MTYKITKHGNKYDVDISEAGLDKTAVQDRYRGMSMQLAGLNTHVNNVTKQRDGLDAEVAALEEAMKAASIEVKKTL